MGQSRSYVSFFVTLSSQSCAHIPNNFMLNWNMAIIIGNSREFLGGLLCCIKVFTSPKGSNNLQPHTSRIVLSSVITYVLKLYDLLSSVEHK